MGDPLSIAASVGGLVSLGIQVCQGLTSYYQAYTGRGESVAKTARSLESLCGSLQYLERILTSRRFHQDDEHIVQQVSDLIRSCEDPIDELRLENDKFSDDKKQEDFIHSAKQRFRKVAYPFREGTLLRLRECVNDVRENVSFALDTLQLKVTGDIQDDLEDAANLLATIKVDQVSSQVLKWLKAPDPTQNHNNACEKRHPNTGIWLIENYEFVCWLNSESSFLWLFGAVGCGKTVLSSTVIQHAFRLRRSDRTRGIAFYYFDFNDSFKQDSAGLLRSLLLQLSTQLDDQQVELAELHRRYATGEAPTTALLITLRRIIETYVEVHIVIDALDESPPGHMRDSVLEVLTQIQKWSIKHLHILVTSRDEPDIRVELEELNVKPLLIPSQEVDKDIAKYVQQNLRSQRALKKWEHNFDDIERTLTTRANGMFRWVECQFASLKSCRSQAQLEETLRSLPGSLRETYFRIFQRIESSAVGDVRSILTWLCFAKQPIRLDSMNEMLAVRTNSEVKYDNRRCYVNKWDILSVCPGLVSLDTDEPHLENDFARPIDEIERPMLSDHGTISCNPKTTTIQLLRIAHFSVFEYLVSDPLQEFSASEYHLQVATANAELTKCCIIILSETARRREDGKGEDIYTPTTKYCARFWDQHLRDCREAQHEVKLACDFLSSRPKYELWRQLIDNPEEAYIKKNIFRRLQLIPTRNLSGLASDSGSPAFYAARLGLTKTLIELIRMGSADVDEFVTGSLLRRQRDLTLLQAASYSGHLDCVQALLNEGADLDFLPPGSWSALRLACHNGHLDIANLLIESGSKIDALEDCGVDCNVTTLLHYACEAGLHDIAAALLKRGANKNALDHNGETPLHLAAIHGHGSIVQLLLQNGANKNIKNHRHRRPVFEAIATLALPPDVLGSLLYPGLVSERDIRDSTVLLAIAGNTAFHDLGGDMNTVDWILNNGCEIDAQDVEGFTALHLALFNGHFKLAKKLLDHGSRIDVRSRQGWLPLHSLASCGRELEMNQYGDFDFVSLINTLSMDGALIDTPGELGLCPAHLTVLTEIPNFLESFVRAGANFIIQDMHSSTALDYLIPRTGHQGFSVEAYSWILGEQAVLEFQRIFGTVENFVSEEPADVSVRGDPVESRPGPQFQLHPLQPGFKEVDLSRRVQLQAFDRMSCKILLGMVLIYVTMTNEDSSLIDMVFQHRTTFEISIDHFSAIALSSQINNQLRSRPFPRELPEAVTDIPELQSKWLIAKFLGALDSKDINYLKSQIVNDITITEMETFLAEYGASVWSFVFLFDDPYSTILTEMFINNGADINKQDREGNSALEIAIKLGRDTQLLLASNKEV